MISSTPTKLTLDEFLKLPETKPASEYLGEQIYQKPMPQGEHSTLQSRLSAAINEVAIEPKLAHAFTELRCTFGGSSIVPDITVFEWERIPLRPNGRIANKFEIAPDWTIEILSPDQSANRVIRKITFCLNHGTKLGWLIDPEDESVSIFRRDRTPEVKADTDLLPALEILQDWQISTADLFGWLSFI